MRIDQRGGGGKKERFKGYMEGVSLQVISEDDGGGEKGHRRHSTCLGNGGGIVANDRCRGDPSSLGRGRIRGERIEDGSLYRFLFFAREGEGSGSP